MLVISIALQYLYKGGHYYTYYTDNRDRDQNLIGPILGLDRLILAGSLPWSLDFY